jgi:hypothetical protein
MGPMPLSFISPKGAISVEMMPSLTRRRRCRGLGDAPDAADVIVTETLINDFEFFSAERRQEANSTRG